MRQPDPQKLDALVGRMVGELGASVTGATVLLGDQLGIYKAMADGVSVTPESLARKTGYKERYLREWLSAQAAAEYIDYNDEDGTFSLSPEQAMAFADEDSPAFFGGAFEIMQSIWLDEPKIAEAFRTGAGVGWHDHSQCLFRGTERFFRPGYSAPDRGMDTVHRRPEGQARTRRQGGGCRLRPRRFHHTDGQGVPDRETDWLRLPRPLHRTRQSRRQGSRSR